MVTVGTSNAFAKQYKKLTGKDISSAYGKDITVRNVDTGKSNRGTGGSNTNQRTEGTEESFKDVTLIEQSNAAGQVEKVSIADNQGRTIRELRSGESIKYTAKGRTEGLNAREQAMVQDSYKDAMIVTQSNARGEVERVSITDNNGRTLRELTPEETIRYTPKDRLAGLNANERRMVTANDLPEDAPEPTTFKGKAEKYGYVVATSEALGEYGVQGYRTNVATKEQVKKLLNIPTAPSPREYVEYKAFGGDMANAIKVARVQSKEGVIRFAGETSPFIVASAINPIAGAAVGFEWVRESIMKTGGQERIAETIISYENMGLSSKAAYTAAVAPFLVAGAFVGAEFSSGVRNIRLKPYLADAESKVTKVTQDIARNPMREPIVKPKITTSTIDDVTTLSINPKKKGRISEVEYFPSGEAGGKVTEVRKVGRYFETFEGTIQVVKSGGYREILPLQKNIVRVTEINKEGIGSLRLLKKGKEIFKQKIDVSKVGDDILNQIGRTKKEVVKADRNFNAASVSEDFIARGSKGEQIKVLSNNPQQVSKKVLGEGEVSQKLFGDVKTGKYRIETEANAFSDIVTVGERKGMVRIKSPNGEIIYRKRLGQTIEVGTDKSIDKTFTTIKDKNLKQIKEVKEVSPKVNIKSETLAGGEVVEIYLKPGTKSQKAIALAYKTKIESAKSFAKQADEVRNAIDSNIKIQDSLMLPKQKVNKAGQINIFDDTVSNVNMKAPSYVGGEGGLLSESAYVFNKAKSMMPELSGTTFVELPTRVNKPSSLPSFADVPTPVLSSNKLLTAGLVAPMVIGNMDLTSGIKTNTLTNDLTISNINAKNDNLLKFDGKFDLKNKDDTLNKSNQRQNQSQAQTQPQAQDQFLGQQMKQELKQEQIFKQAARTKIETRINKTPLKEKIKIKPPKIPNNNKIQRLAAQVGTSEFKAFFKKGGKDVALEETFTSKESAKSALVKKLKGSIAASGFLETGGKKVKVSELGFLGAEFGVGKKEDYRLVQKKERRLTKRGQDVREIKAFKRTNKKNLFGI
jgi:hypothetical protein